MDQILYLDLQRQPLDHPYRLEGGVEVEWGVIKIAAEVSVEEILEEEVFEVAAWVTAVVAGKLTLIFIKT